MGTDPWVIYFDRFVSEAEIRACEAHLGSKKFAHMDNRESLFCFGSCEQADIMQTLVGRAGNITRVPRDNIEFVQTVRYKEGMSFKAHHDNHPDLHLLPAGNRIFSIFVYLSDVENGGATEFPQLGIVSPPKRGAAVLFQNTLGVDPDVSDLRATHKASKVEAGEKRGLDLWVHQYNYKRSWQMGCTSTDVAESFSRLLASEHRGSIEDSDDFDPEEEWAPPDAEDGSLTVVFENPHEKAIDIYAVNPANSRERLVGTSVFDGPFTASAMAGDVFHVRSGVYRDGQFMMSYTVRDAPLVQNVRCQTGARSDL